MALTRQSCRWGEFSGVIADAKAIVEAGPEVVSHGWRWIDYQFVSEEVEREHLRRAVASIEQATGSRPLGGYAAPLPKRGGAGSDGDRDG